MPITASDIKLLASRVMDDIPNGGGAPTATVIQDGVSNAIFNDISEVDRAGGKVSLRKMFVGVLTPTTDVYLGANLIVSELPEDPNVSVTIFASNDVFDKRAEASSRVAAYLNAGPEWPGYLLEDHIAGQRVIQLFARPGVVPPAVGRTLVLRQNEGQPNQVEQYVRVVRVSTEERTFTSIPTSTWAPLDYQAQIITCDLSDALRSDFAGSPASRLFAIAAGKTKLRDTVVADAATYYGAAKLALPAEIGDVSIKVGSVYSQLVPNAQAETAVIDVRPSSDYSTVLATSPSAVSVGGAPFSQRIRVGQENRGYNYVNILRPLPAPGTVKITYRALGNTYQLTDDGSGNLVGSGSGIVNYLTGSVSVTLQVLPDDRSAVVFYWGQRVAYTSLAGTLNYRPPEYAFTLNHNGITPGSLVITWPSGGVVKTATVNSAGVISGDATGEANHVAGLVFIRPAHMLDAGGEFSADYTWSEVVEEVKTALVADPTGSVTFSLAEEPTPGSIEVQWLTTRETSTTSGASSTAGQTTKSTSAGSITQVVSETVPIWAVDIGDLPIVPYDPFRGPKFSVTLQKKSFQTYQKSASSSATYMTTTEETSRQFVTVAHAVTDDAAGGFFDGTFGVVSYAAKTATLKVAADYSETSYKSNYERADAFESLNATGDTTGAKDVTPGAAAGGGGNSTAKGGEYSTAIMKEVFGGVAHIRYRTGLGTPQFATTTFSPPAVVIDLCPRTKDAVVPGSVQFTWMGTVYADFEGVIYRGRTDNDPGIESGLIDYQSGLVAMVDYVVAGSPTNFSVQSLWTRKPAPSVANVVFQVQLSPLKPGGLIFSCLDIAGQQLIGTAGLDGLLIGSHMRGMVDFDTGLVEIQFGDYVTDATLAADQKNEWWYSVDDVRTDGKIWRPWSVDPGTLRYNAVSYTYLPLDANILGLDPVRLPSDGRVPIFRPGYYGVIGHTGAIGPINVSNGQTIDCERVRLSRIRVLDAAGLSITTGYTVDLDAGTLTFIDVAGLAQPVTIKHHIEDMAMIADVQINGSVRFTRQLTHDFPAGSVLSSAIMMGDLRARITNLFDQQTWGNVWSGAPIGATAPASFNDAAHPIQVSNAGALTESWAIVFTSATAFQVIGEHVGIVAVGNTSTDCAPLNPASNQPYFTIPAVGWGIGWAAGNALRIDTSGPFFPFWAVLTVQQGQETTPNHNFSLLTRGDIDRP